MSKVTRDMLTQGQLSGFEALTNFYLNPHENCMQIRGGSGTGKSTLLRFFMEEMPKLEEAAKLLFDDFEPPELAFTATTNQACEALCSNMGSGYDVKTIHSKLGLRLQRNLQTGRNELVANPRADKPFNELIVVDEASFIDQKLLGFHFSQSDKCKFVFVGDDRQLTPVGSLYMPAFKMGNIIVELTEVKRQSPGPLYDLCMALRETVVGAAFPKIKPDGQQLYRVTNNQFPAECLEIFKHPEIYGNAKIICFSNDRVNEINRYCSKHILGSAEPFEGQRMLANEAVVGRNHKINNGEEVYLDEVRPHTEFGVPGWLLKLRGKATVFFMPVSQAARKAKEREMRAAEEWSELRIIDENWVDLRPSFACTINKSQGSTYDTILIDLGDIGRKVHHVPTLARMLYVGISRARSRVGLVGDL